MSSSTQILTACQLSKLPRDGQRLELVDGVLRMMAPAGHEHGKVAMRLAWRLAQYVESHELGVVYAAETGFLLSRDPDTVRAADAAYVRHDRLPQVLDVSGYLPLAPDLVAEVMSPGDTSTEVEDKALTWLRAGTLMVLVVHPTRRAVTVFRAAGNVVQLTGNAQLDGADVVPGWTVRVSEFFD
jgi:Uma2 family endonuclease